MSAAMPRREFFRRVGGRDAPVRAPGSLDEADFDAACDRCHACIRACPEAILIPGAGRLPEVDFVRGGCTFCGRCAEACAPGAILPAEAWDRRAVVTNACLEPQGITCRVCESSCDAVALRFRPRLGGRSDVVIDLERCTGCGACVATCPAGAIRISLPAEEAIPCPTA